MADILPADLVVLYQDAFAHFDTDNDGIIITKLLGPLLRHCGENPSEAEVQVRFAKTNLDDWGICSLLCLLLGYGESSGQRCHW